MRYGFAVLPAGIIEEDGVNIASVGSRCLFWTATQATFRDYAAAVGFASDNYFMSGNTDKKNGRYSVRCIMD